MVPAKMVFARFYWGRGKGTAAAPRPRGYVPGNVPTFLDDFYNVAFSNTQFSSLTCLVVVNCSAFRGLLCREFIWRWRRGRFLLPVSATINVIIIIIIIISSSSSSNDETLQQHL